MPRMAAAAEGMAGDLSAEDVVYSKYKDESQLPAIMALLDADLSEPYSIYTYRYFINGWPNLCFLAHISDELVGVIASKAAPHKKDPKITRGYVAMLAVQKRCRKLGIGSQLVSRSVGEMAKTCDEISLETEVTNTGALRLYANLGFVRDKRLRRYYLNGNDAFRLKLWLHRSEPDAADGAATPPGGVLTADGGSATTSS